MWREHTHASTRICAVEPLTIDRRRKEPGLFILDFLPRLRTARSLSRAAPLSSASVRACGTEKLSRQRRHCGALSQAMLVAAAASSHPPSRARSSARRSCCYQLSRQAWHNLLYSIVLLLLASRPRSRKRSRQSTQSCAATAKPTNSHTVSPVRFISHEDVERQRTAKV